jgi:2,3-dihydroxybenzoate decarboxylase
MRTIALEEHFVTPELAGYGAPNAARISPGFWAKASAGLLETADERLALMGAAGLDMQVLSLNAPGIQAETDARTAVTAAARVNDYLAGLVAAHPSRFAGFAALPLQDGEAAAKELHRAVTELGLCGALVNAHTQGRYLDDPSLRVVWAAAQDLDVPLYLHPANGVDVPHVLSGHPELLGAIWSWGTDTASHALRLVFGGVFDEFPRAKLLLGHMGEGLPFTLWRLDSRWEVLQHHGIELAREHPSAYLRENLYVTTSGVCDAPPLVCAVQALGADHVLFGTDYPFEDMATATKFLATAPLSDADRAKISHANAERLLHIAPAA